MTATIDNPVEVVGEDPAGPARPRRRRSRVLPSPRRWFSSAASVVRGLRLPKWLGSLTVVGWSVAALAAVTWILGVILGWDEFLIISSVALLLLLLSVPFLFGRLATAAFVEVTPTRVQPGTRVIGRVVVRNDWDRRVRGVQVEVPVGRALARFAIPSLAAGVEHEELFSVPTRRRAVIPIGPVSSSRGDALGLFRRAIRWGEPIIVRVHPATVPIPPVGTGLIRDLEGHTTDHLSNSDVAFHTLREYTPGDDRRHVHWRSSARIGKLLVRQFVDTRRTHVVVYLDQALTSYNARTTAGQGGDSPEAVQPGSEEFEVAASVAGSIVRRVFTDEMDLTLLTDDQVVGGSSPIPSLDALSAAALSSGRWGSGDAWSHASVRIARYTPDASIVVFVTGPLTTPSQVRLAAAPVSRDARVVAIRVSGVERTTWREVEGITLIDLADFGDLAAVLLAGAR